MVVVTTYRGVQMEEMVTCTTCDGAGQAMMRGASHRDYDEPDYMDTCGICGGTGELPARMFTDAGDAAHDTDCACASHGICEYWNTVPVGPRAE
jgi:DnaJ-class molecular chaperone